MFCVNVDGANFMSKCAVHTNDVNNAKEQVISRFCFGNSDVETTTKFINSCDDLGVTSSRGDTKEFDVQRYDLSDASRRKGS